MLELGYRVEPIPCACIHDTTPKDALRKVNNDDQLVNGKHPDSEKFVARWTNRGLKGPVIGSLAGKFSFIVNHYLRCLYAPIYEPGHNLQHRTKRGLREALASRCLVVEVDYVQDGVDYLFDVARAFKPHLILTQFQSIDNAHGISANVISELRWENPQARFVNWNGDYHPEHLSSRAYMELIS